MKSVPPPCPGPETGPKYWRSLDQLVDTPAFREWAEREFPAGASELADPVTRRHFAKIMAASFLLAGFGLTGCRRPEETIHPFAKTPEGYVHGVPRFYATAMPTRSSAIPLLVRSSEGRPTKIEGNDLHPDSVVHASDERLARAHAGTDFRAQASLLSLYDPDRARRFLHKGKPVTREAAFKHLEDLGRRAANDGGKGLCLLLEQSSSPSRDRLVRELAGRWPQAAWFVYEPVDCDASQRAARVAFGRPLRAFNRLEKAKRIVALDCDFLGTEPESFRLARGFAEGRSPQASQADGLNRLYVVESSYSLTGASADHRLRLAPSRVLPLAALLLAAILEEVGSNGTLVEPMQLVPQLRKLGQGAESHLPWVQNCAKDLVAGAGESIVLAGYRQPLVVQLLAWAANAVLGSLGKAIEISEEGEPFPFGEISALAERLRGGTVETLLILGGNPVYNAPADLDWVQMQRKAGEVIRLGYYEDETAQGADWHLPQAHFLESWGDARTRDGMWVPVQPLIQPLFGGLTELEVLSRVGASPVSIPYEIVRQTLKEKLRGTSFEDAWKRFLHDGSLPDSAGQAVLPQLRWDCVRDSLETVLTRPLPSNPGLEVMFQPSYALDDGRHSNNGWLQELPDPITKVTWDNVILLSGFTAKALGVTAVEEQSSNLQVPVVNLESGGRVMEGAVWIQPGLADGVAVVTLGYGRSGFGRVGGNVGYNGYLIRTSEAPHFTSGAKLTVTGRRYPVACTQNHGFMEGRPIVREVNLEQYRQHSDFLAGMKIEKPPGGSALYPNPLDARKPDSLHQWGMVVDLSRCTGCAACSLACQSENNIPIVGKDQVGRGREMHWIRVDRYFAGSLEDPQVAQQPMMCQHCESAPCETVCPVNATVHDDEGLNLMVYNRCVGTRYCSNNCPYKVRRFNFFDYNLRPLDELYKSPLVHQMGGEWGLKRWWKDRDRGSRKKDEWDLAKLARNPDVTLRMRGVMEKCTFCLQRIESAKVARKLQGVASGNVEVKDGTLQVACEQACPTEAILFGNLKDSGSRVSKARAQDRNYSVMESLGTHPRVTYLVRVRNPNPNMPDYHLLPLSAQEREDRKKRRPSQTAAPARQLAPAKGGP